MCGVGATFVYEYRQIEERILSIYCHELVHFLNIGPHCVHTCMLVNAPRTQFVNQTLYLTSPIRLQPSSAT